MSSIFSFCYGKVDTLPTSTSLTCQITTEGANLTLTGQPDNVMTTREDILNLYPAKIHLNLNIPDQDYNRLKAETERIAQATDTIITPTVLASQNVINVHITGTPNNTELARVQILVFLDKLSQLTVDTIAIPYNLHHLVCGRKRIGLQSILQDTNTSIYFPSPFSHNNDTNLPLIYITGESSNVARAKEMLRKLATQKAQSMYQKDAVLHPRKLDWMLLHYRDDLRKMMRDNGAFIGFPKIASGSNLVTVYAENRVNAERTCRSLLLLACSIFEAVFYFNQDNPVYSVSQLSQISEAEVFFDSSNNCLQVFGTEHAIRKVVYELSFTKVFHTVLNIELSLDQQEFISGKKSGKINKIMKTTGAKIKFVPFSEYNFIIEMGSYQINKTLEGFSLLQEELPAEISFYVPEKYHKRIIGVGGKNIQRIMKKYGVYVKFSNAEEVASLGGYFSNEDNVVARTPMKNRANLQNLRVAVLELIGPKDRDDIEHVLHDVSFCYRRSLMHELKEVTKSTNTQLVWPDAELADDTVTIIGPESQVTIAVEMIKSIIPEKHFIHMPNSTYLTSILESDSYQRIVQTINNDYKVSVKLELNIDWEEQLIVLKTTKANIENLNSSVEILVKFLNNQQAIACDDTSTSILQTNNSNSFPFFNNAVLGTASAPLTPSSSSSLFPILKSYSLFDYPSSNNYSRGLVSSRTTGNIRALFDPLTSVPFVSPLNFRSSSSSQNDIWLNPPQTFGMQGLESRQQYDYGSQNPPRSDIAPALSTSTGSNNSSMHSTQSMDAKLANQTPLYSNNLSKSLEYPTLFTDESIIAQNLLNSMSLDS